MKTIIFHYQMNENRKMSIVNISLFQYFGAWAYVYNGSFIVFIDLTVGNHAFQCVCSYCIGKMCCFVKTIARTFILLKILKNEGITI